MMNAYLTIRQKEIWKLKQTKTTQAEIGRILGITRQAIYDAEKIIHLKMESALMDAANVGMLEINYVDSTKGILLGTQPQSDRKVIITFSPKNGVQTWHLMESNCHLCKWTNRCKTRLIDEAEERNIKEDWGNLPPSKIASRIFRDLIPGLDELDES